MLGTIDGITQEPQVNFVGKDGFYWWVGEVESNEDPDELGRVKVRVLGYYTNVSGGTTADLPEKNLPWATVLQHTSQPGNDGQGESSGQLQPGAIVMGFFMDGDNAQMPIVIGVMRVNKSDTSQDEKKFTITGEKMEPGVGVNRAALHPLFPNEIMASTKSEGYHRQSDKNTVALINSKSDVGGPGSPCNMGSCPGVNGSGVNPTKPKQPAKPVPAANGVGGPWKTLEYQLNYIIEDIADTAGNLVKAEDGDFLDIVTGKIVTAKVLTAKLQNFLGSVFTQVVSAIRQQLANLAESLQLASLLGSATGAPYVTWTVIQTAVTTILKALCVVDNKILSFIQDPVGSVTNILNSFLDGVIDKAAMVLQGVQATIDSVVCSVQKVLNDVLKIIDTVKSTVDTIGKAKEIIEAWQKGSEIFAEGFDLIKNGIGSISGLLALFIKFLGGGCDRKPDGGADTVGWFPLFGVTHCTDAELDEINKLRGDSRGTCGSSDGGGSSGGGLFDSIFEQADPYLTVAKTFIDGAYEMHMGTPGRSATQRKDASGTTHTSVNLNNYNFAKWKAYQAARLEQEKTGTKKTDDELKAEADAAVKANNSNKKDTGNLVADHISWAGNRTQEVHGDDCIAIDNDKCETIYGDYHLDIVGDCHISVGGGFFFNAQGAPKSVDKKGNKKNTKIQKHTINFGSDVDVSTAGAKFELQGAECNIASVKTLIENSGDFKVKSGAVTISGVDTVISADNAIHNVAAHIYNQVNTPPTTPKAKTGILTVCAGSIDTILTPGGSATDAIPRYTIVNPSGPFSGTFGATGYNCNVLTGAWNVNVAGGLAVMTASTNITLAAGKAMALTAGATIKAFSATIHLN